MAETFNAPVTTGDILAHCADMTLNVEEITIKTTGSEATYAAGQVLAEYTATADDGLYAVADPSGSNGLNTAAAVILQDVTVPAGANAKVLALTGQGVVFKANLTVPGNAAQQAVFLHQLRRNKGIRAR